MKSKYNAVEAVQYTINEPISVDFSVSEDIIDIGELAGKPYSPQQIVDLGYFIIFKH